jgi:hypothetical protein
MSASLLHLSAEEIETTEATDRRKATAEIVRLALDIFETSFRFANNEALLVTLSLDDMHTSTLPFDQGTIDPSICQSCDDDSSSMSSVSFPEDEIAIENWFTSPPRSIFDKYWSKHGGSRSLSRSPRIDEDVSSSSFDVTLKAESLQPSAAASHDHTRRKIFAQANYPSAPQLSLAHCARDCILVGLRKTQSSSSLSPPMESCLRKGKFTTVTKCSMRRCSSDNSCVSFSEDIDVRLYQRDMERFAKPGWSSWFV